MRKCEISHLGTDAPVCVQNTFSHFRLLPVITSMCLYLLNIKLISSLSLLLLLLLLCFLWKSLLFHKTWIQMKTEKHSKVSRCVCSLEYPWWGLSEGEDAQHGRRPRGAPSGDTAVATSSIRPPLQTWTQLSPLSPQTISHSTALYLLILQFSIRTTRWRSPAFKSKSIQVYVMYPK